MGCGAVRLGRRERRPTRTRLARILKATKWGVLIAWIAAAVVATRLASGLEDVQRNDASAYLPDGFEPSLVARLAEPDPDWPEAQTALVVYDRPGDVPLTGADRSAITGDQRAATAIPAARPTGTVLFSADRAAALFAVQIQPAHADDDTSPKSASPSPSVS